MRLISCLVIFVLSACYPFSLSAQAYGNIHSPKKAGNAYFQEQITLPQIQGIQGIQQIQGDFEEAEQELYDYNEIVTYNSPPNLKPLVHQNTYDEITININGLYNLPADKEVAVFSITQVGSNIEEVNTLIDERIQRIKGNLENAAISDFFVDMISFVPLYEIESSKKLFNKRTYNEIPKGFKVKKNLHISYSQSETLHQIVATCAQQEVYDLIRVDYVSQHLEMAKDSLQNRATQLYQKQLTHYENILGVALDTAIKTLNEGYNVAYPVERYQLYRQAYSQASLPLKKGASVQEQPRESTVHYTPIFAKKENFVLNPMLTEPSIQVVYDLKINVRIPKKKEPQPTPPAPPTKEFWLVTPQGGLKQIPVE